MIENFIETKSLRKILERLRRKVDIFIRTKNIFNSRNYVLAIVLIFKSKCLILIFCNQFLPLMECLTCALRAKVSMTQYNMKNANLKSKNFYLGNC